MNPLDEKFRAVTDRIERACQRSGREKESVTLVAVSKLHPTSAIEQAYALGQRRFGENYAQELRDKARTFEPLADIEWHAIGSLQTNKAKYVSQHAHSFHALDRVELAEELNRRRQGVGLFCYIEVDLADEPKKTGISPGQLGAFLDQLEGFTHLNVIGLMCLPPLGETPETGRPYFRRLKALATEHRLTGLSMGTTFDFEVAIEEGATCVRVGTALFGERK